MDGKKVLNEFELRKRLQILGGQCLNIAGNIIARDESNSEMPDSLLSQLVFDLAEELFDKGVEKKFYEWADDTADDLIKLRCI